MDEEEPVQLQQAQEEQASAVCHDCKELEQRLTDDVAVMKRLMAELLTATNDFRSEVVPMTKKLITLCDTLVTQQKRARDEIEHLRSDVDRCEERSKKIGRTVMAMEKKVGGESATPTLDAQIQEGKKKNAAALAKMSSGAATK